MIPERTLIHLSHQIAKAMWRGTTKAWVWQVTHMIPLPWEADAGYHWEFVYFNYKVISWPALLKVRLCLNKNNNYIN